MEIKRHIGLTDGLISTNKAQHRVFLKASRLSGGFSEVFINDMSNPTISKSGSQISLIELSETLSIINNVDYDPNDSSQMTDLENDLDSIATRNFFILLIYGDIDKDLLPISNLMSNLGSDLWNYVSSIPQVSPNGNLRDKVQYVGFGSYDLGIVTESHNNPITDDETNINVSFFDYDHLGFSGYGKPLLSINNETYGSAGIFIEELEELDESQYVRLTSRIRRTDNVNESSNNPSTLSIMNYLDIEVTGDTFADFEEVFFLDSGNHVLEIFNGSVGSTEIYSLEITKIGLSGTIPNEDIKMQSFPNSEMTSVLGINESYTKAVPNKKDFNTAYQEYDSILNNEDGFTYILDNQVPYWNINASSTIQTPYIEIDHKLDYMINLWIKNDNSLSGRLRFSVECYDSEQNIIESRRIHGINENTVVVKEVLSNENKSFVQFPILSSLSIDHKVESVPEPIFGDISNGGLSNETPNDIHRGIIVNKDTQYVRILIEEIDGNNGNMIIDPRICLFTYSLDNNHIFTGNIRDK